MTLNDLFNKTTNLPGTVSDNQWATYTKLCKQKFVKPVDRTSFNSSTLSKEIERLISLPFARKAFPQQIARFKEMCNQLGIKCPADDIIDKWSNVEISARMSILGKKLPVTENQIKMLKNFYRFDLITEDMLAGVDNMTAASEFIAKYTEALTKVSEGKLTLNQAERIVQLEEELHQKHISIKELSSVTFDEASTRIEALKQEQENRREALTYGWDNSGSMFNMNVDTSRDFQHENDEKLSFADKDFAQKMRIVQKLQYIVNTGNDNNDSISEQNIDDIIVDLYELASVIGESQAAYNVMTAAMDEGEPTAVCNRSRRNRNTSK